jgi:hypothetical protein
VSAISRRRPNKPLTCANSACGQAAQPGMQVLRCASVCIFGGGRRTAQHYSNPGDLGRPAWASAGHRPAQHLTALNGSDSHLPAHNKGSAHERTVEAVCVTGAPMIQEAGRSTCVSETVPCGSGHNDTVMVDPSVLIAEFGEDAAKAQIEGWPCQLRSETLPAPAGADCGGSRNRARSAADGRGSR